MRAIQLTEFGNPVDVLNVVEIPEPPEPGADEVLINVEFSPVNPNDLSLARGTYGVRPRLPAVIGNEGVGRVLRVGSAVDTVSVGDRVLLPLHSFAWRERMVIAARDLFSLPQQADPRQLAMLGINPPTAALLLSEFVSLRAGDWVLQNAANSGVGRWVIAFAKAHGLRTVNLVRRPELVKEIEALGGDAVLLDSPDVGPEIKRAIGGADLRLALDGVGGAATGILAAALGLQGTAVLYSAMSRAANVVNPLDVIFRALTIRGFFVGHPQHAQKIPAAIKEAAALLAAGDVSIPVAAVYPLGKVKDAVAHVQRGGKVLLDITA
jgi:NADPH:quinone reductase-like Zn-dependent oxidoreductase